MVIAKGVQRLLVVFMRRIGERLQLFGIPPRTTRVFRRSHPGSFQQAGIASLWISRGDTLDFDAVLPSIAEVVEVVEGLAAHSLQRLSEGRLSSIKRATKAVGRIRDAEARAPAGRSEEHTSALQSLMRISYAVFCMQKQHTKK